MKTRIIAIIACIGAFACTAILGPFELEVEPECWCGEEWQGQVNGAMAYNLFSIPSVIPQIDTGYSTCVSQLQHASLNDGDPTLTDAIAAASVAQCELAAVGILGDDLGFTTCADQGAGVSHVGSCWEADPELLCPLLDECRGKYDCDSEPVWKDYGDETGGGSIEPEECSPQ